MHGDVTAGSDARATTVRAQVESLKNSLGDKTWEMAALFSEARAKSFHHLWGFSDFDEYIDKSNFDIGSREVRYRIRVNDVSLQLGITRTQLKAVNISKLKEIFSLDPVKQSDDIVRLVDDAVTMSLEEVRQSVRELKGSDPETDLCWWNIQLLRRAKEETILPALQKVKLEYGPTMSDVPGQSVEISDGRALEMLCADKLSEPDEELVRLQNAAEAEEA